MEIILASGSPRRKMLMDQVGIKCRVVVSGADETIDGPPDVQVVELAKRKALSVINSDECRGGILPPVIIAADTLVYIDDEVLGKPKDKDDAFNMLKKLSGNKHTVYTGVAIVKTDKPNDIHSFVSKTDVYFRNLSDKEILAYIETGEPFDKAGAYGVQDKGALLVSHIVGDFFTVVGLPIAKVYEVLRDIDTVSTLSF